MDDAKTLENLKTASKNIALALSALQGFALAVHSTPSIVAIARLKEMVSGEPALISVKLDTMLDLMPLLPFIQTMFEVEPKLIEYAALDGMGEALSKFPIRTAPAERETVLALLHTVLDNEA
jgi:hypothetical protein